MHPCCIRCALHCICAHHGHSPYCCACTAGEGSRLSKRRGTLTFLSPEAYRQSYGLKSDLWSLGVMLYW